MNRIDFMNQLESLLQNIAPGEREEALQYYNCYFDDAGAENEQEVLEALGTPARVAENIKRDLMENSGAEMAARKVKASDRALMEYGKAAFNEAEEPGKESASSPEGAGGSSGRTAGQQNGGSFGSGVIGSSGNSFGSSNGGSAESESSSMAGTFGTYSQESWQEQSSGGGNDSQAWPGYGDPYGYSLDRTQGDGHSGMAGQAGMAGQPGKGLPGWAVALIVIAVVLFSPAAAGLVAGAFGILAGWIGMMVGFGVASIVLLIILVLLVVLGVICFFVNPWVGCALMGGGLICGALGIGFLMLTVAMAGIVTPAVFRGIANLFRRVKGAR